MWANRLSQKDNFYPLRDEPEYEKNLILQCHRLSVDFARGVP